VTKPQEILTRIAKVQYFLTRGEAGGGLTWSEEGEKAKKFQLVDEAGPGVMRLQAALTDGEAATPVLRTISLITPHLALEGSFNAVPAGPRFTRPP
jgi:Protein of unknown function (DUF3313)